MFICLPLFCPLVCLFVHLLCLYIILAVYLFTHSSVFLFYLPLCLCVFRSLYLSGYLSIFELSIRLSVCLSPVCWSVYLSICLCVCILICSHIYQNSETRMTASVPKQDPNTQKVQRNAIYWDKKNAICCRTALEKCTHLYD